MEDRVLNYDLPSAALIACGALAAASGRFVLANGARRFRPRLSAERRRHLKAAEDATIYVTGANAVKDSVGDTVVDSLTSPIGIVIQLVALVALGLFLRLDWADILSRNSRRSSDDGAGKK